MGPLAALGDGFFWLSLKPAVGALCAALVPVLGAWAAVLFLVLYNAVHLTLRAPAVLAGAPAGGPAGGGGGAGQRSPRGGRGCGRSRRRARVGWRRPWPSSSERSRAGWRVPLLAGGCLALGALATCWWPGRFPLRGALRWRRCWRAWLGAWL